MIVPGHDPLWHTIFRNRIPDGAMQPASVDIRLSDFIIRPDGENEDRLPLPPFLFPGEFILAETLEYVCVPLTHAMKIEGKSSLGRKGLTIHVTAGWVDPGFNGVLTLEMVNFSRVPIALTPGMWIGQVSLHQMLYPVKPEHGYKGKYQYAKTVEAAKK